MGKADTETLGLPSWSFYKLGYVRLPAKGNFHSINASSSHHMKGARGETTSLQTSIPCIGHLNQPWKHKRKDPRLNPSHLVIQDVRKELRLVNVAIGEESAVMLHPLAYPARNAEDQA
jgi:hypothetical protein